MNATHLLRASVIAVATTIVAASFVASDAEAAAPMVKKSAPGYYRMMLGDFEITALSDGTVALPMDKLLNNPAEKTAAAFAKYYVKTPVETSVTAYLINTGTKLVMVDAGAGVLFGPTLGNVLANLKASGYQPEQVDEIYITHMHGDHMGGLLVDGKVAYPDAVVRADKHDAEFWLSEAEMAKVPVDKQGGFKGAQAMFAPYIKAGKFKIIEGSGELVPGVSALTSHGHTPGHNTYVVESKGEKLILWGDLMHVASVQFDDPSVTIQFDSDNAKAAEQRKKAYADAAKNGYVVGSTHISFPGLGRLTANGTGYIWVPVNYSPVK